MIPPTTTSSLSPDFEILSPEDPRFPPLLKRIESPPEKLFVRGDWSLLHRPCIAVVGSREPSVLSLQWVRQELGAFLASEKPVLLSGGARGIDQAAHKAALLNGVPTVVFFPSGLLQMYPSVWQTGGAADWVLRHGGLLVSEYAPQVEIRKDHFLARNRLIAGGALVTLLVEARQRSGTLVTAKAAIEQGRPLWVVPSHPLDANAAGGLSLIAEGAQMVRDAEDLRTFWGSELLVAQNLSLN